MAKNKWKKPTAEKYDYYARKYPTYKKTSKFLVKLAKIKKGTIIIDLACGTGITTKEILEKTGSFGKVIGVDLSKEMLNIAKKKIKQKNVSFIHSPAEEIDRVIKEKVDLILCNSAFFIMDMDKTLKSIRRVLRDGGMFIFNLSEQYHKFPKKLKINLHFPIILKMAMQKIVVEKYKYKIKSEKEEIGFLNSKTINKVLKNNSFKIDYYKTLKLKRTPKDFYEFLKIPLMTRGMFPNLDYSERMEILDMAYKKVKKPKKFKMKWTYFVVTKNLAFNKNN